MLYIKKASLSPESATDIVYVKEYDEQTGEVLETTTNKEEAKTFETESEMNDVVDLMNNFEGQNFVGHLPNHKPR